MTSHLSILVAVLLCAGAPWAVAAEPVDSAMAELARRAGCDLCHEPAPRTFASGSKRYLAPSWQQVAERYRADARAEDRLTKIVLAGTGPLLTDQHWRGKVFFSDMPPNEVQLSPGDARALVRWILTQPQ